MVTVVCKSTHACNVAETSCMRCGSGAHLVAVRITFSKKDIPLASIHVQCNGCGKEWDIAPVEVEY